VDRGACGSYPSNRRTRSLSAVTSAIIGPRTMEHLESQLVAADIELSDDAGDRIDEIVPPGVTIKSRR
jgi:aryl-alcohol dehydrogenase-like predicted oxidoreductase